MIGIINYGLGNIKAFCNIYKRLNMPYKLVSSINDFNGVKKIILPGVGSFDHAMESLNNSGIRDKLEELVIEKEVPLIGICVGMQMLAESSEEGKLHGLGWIEGKVVKFRYESLPRNAPLPHMGWNHIIPIKKECRLFKDLEVNPRFYFLHSYFFECRNKDNILATANYGLDFTCIVNKGNIYGIQCHPEKSHHNGIKLLKNFGEL